MTTPAMRINPKETGVAWRLTPFLALCSFALTCASVPPKAGAQSRMTEPSPDAASKHGYLTDSPSPNSLSPQSLNQQYALGNWGGVRSRLGQRGLVPTLIFITDPFGNIHGGEREGASAYSLVGLDLRLDTAPALGWKGGQFLIGGAVNFGTSLSRNYIGNSYPVQLADVAGAQPRLTYVSYTQTLLDDKVSFRVGRITLNSVFGEEFAASEYFKKFVSVGFDLVPQGIFLNAPGGAGYPKTTWGARLRYRPSSGFYAQAAVYNADTKQLDGSRHGLDWSWRGPELVMGEVGFRQFSRNTEPTPSRNVKVGAFHTGGTYYRINQHMPEPVSGLFGTYLVLDQRLWSLKAPSSGTSRANAELSRWGEAERSRHIGAFASVVVVPEPRTNIVPYFFNLGLIGYGLSARRPQDILGVGLVHGSNSRGPSLSSSTLSTLPVPPYEQALEITYGVAVRPGVLVQPDFQYVFNPKGTAAATTPSVQRERIPNAIVAGVNIVMNF